MVSRNLGQYFSANSVHVTNLLSRQQHGQEVLCKDDNPGEARLRGPHERVILFWMDTQDLNYLRLLKTTDYYDKRGRQ